jgi:hypothetical protein
MSNDVFAFPVRKWVRGEVPAGRRCEDLLVPKARKQVFICHDPKLTLSKFRRVEAVVDRTGGTSVSSRSCVLVGDSIRRRLRGPTPFGRGEEVASRPEDAAFRVGVHARTLSAGTHSSKRLSVPM